MVKTNMSAAGLPQNAAWFASRMDERILIIKPREQLKNHQLSKAFAGE